MIFLDLYLDLGVQPSYVLHSFLLKPLELVSIIAIVELVLSKSAFLQHQRFGILIYADQDLHV